MSYAGWKTPAFAGANVTNFSADGTKVGVNSFNGQLAGSAALSGKVYFEVTLNQHTSGNQFGIGVVDLNYVGPPLRENYNSTGGAAYVAENGYLIINGGVPGYAVGGIGVGTTIGIALDTAAKKIWFFGSSGQWNGIAGADPASGSGGIDISALPYANLTPLFTVRGGAISDILALNVGGSAYAYSKPSGYADAVGLKWGANSQGCAGSYTRSSDGLTATLVDAGTLIPAQVMVDTGASSGRYYCEFAISGSSFNNIAILGIISSNYAGGPISNATTPGVTVGGNGKVYVGGLEQLTVPALSAGSVVSLFIDVSAKKFFVRVNGGYWNGSSSADPDTGAGAVMVSDLTGSVSPVFAVLLGGVTVMTLNTGQSAYAYTPPSGASNWPVGVPAPVRVGGQAMISCTM